MGNKVKVSMVIKLDTPKFVLKKINWIPLKKSDVSILRPLARV